MKKRYAVLFGTLVLACFLMNACMQTGSSLPVDLKDLAQRIMSTQEDLPAMQEYDETADSFSRIMSVLYSIDPQTVSAGCLYTADGIHAEEVLVLNFATEENAQEAVSLLEQYAEDRYATFAGYAPEMSAMVENHAIAQKGTVVVFIVLPDVPIALEEIKEVLGEDESASRLDVSLDLNDLKEAAITSVSPAVPESSTEEPLTQLYDHDRVLQAIKDQDPTGLEDQNVAVYEVVREFIDTKIQPGMTDFEKEKTAHDWIIEQAAYDPGAMSGNLGVIAETPYNDTPYGALVTGKAKCYGYSSSFQLLMDALEIPCQTIDGASVNWDREHSWNCVELDGQWYLVDVTWDDPVGMMPTDMYLNQTEEFFDTNGPHLWDKSSTPPISSTPYVIV